jgi:hypothetical protein
LLTKSDRTPSDWTLDEYIKKRITYLPLPRERYRMKDIGNGWVEGNAQELLGLTDAETAYVEAKSALTCAVRGRRLALGLIPPPKNKS